MLLDFTSYTRSVLTFLISIKNLSLRVLQNIALRRKIKERF